MADGAGRPGGPEGQELAAGPEPGWLERFGEVAQPGRRRRLVPLATLVAGGICAAVAGASLGGAGVVSGLAAAVVVVAFFAGGSLPMLLTGQQDSAGLGLVVLLTNYAFRLGFALLVLLVAVGAGWADRRAVGVSVVVCALVRVNTAVLLLGRVRGT